MTNSCENKERSGCDYFGVKRRPIIKSEHVLNSIKGKMYTPGPYKIQYNIKPKLKKRYVLGIASAIFLAVSLTIVMLWYYYSINSHYTVIINDLIPPDPEIKLPPSASMEHHFKRAAVCSDGPPCSIVGKEILRMNGSAVDAAIATMFCNGVVNCQSMGIGGGFLMTIYSKSENRAYTLNARESAPSKATENMFEDNRKLSKQGALAIGVPGELRGYWEAHKRFGRLTWAELIQPSVKICREGYNMSLHQSDVLSFNNDNILNDPILKQTFVDPETGKFRRVGSLVHHGVLCETLQIIAERGGEDLYTGDMASQVVQDIKEMGGIITKQDLENYHPQWLEPVSIILKSGEVLYTVPPPGSGILLGFILNILNGYNFTSDSISTTDKTILTYHRIIESFKFAFAKRTELGDMDYVEDIDKLMKNLSSLSYANHIRESVSDSSTSNDPSKYGAVFYNKNDHGTAHISVISPEGDAVSVTSSVNLYFGAGITSKQTGIILNSGMDDFSSPGFNSYFGLPASPANLIEPGKRSLSSMCPSIIVDRNGEVRLVIGASGGTKITTAVAFVIMRHLWFGESIKEAVDASRIHHQIWPMEMSYEYGVLKGIIDGLKKLGHKTSRYRSRGSIICALSKNGNTISANADYRKGGDVFGFD